jgi:hypothetical protein
MVVKHKYYIKTNSNGDPIEDCPFMKDGTKIGSLECLNCINFIERCFDKIWKKKHWLSCSGLSNLKNPSDRNIINPD